jgi:hypothetical protein
MRTTKDGTSRVPSSLTPAMRVLLAGCAAGSISLGSAIALGDPAAGAASSTMTLHYFQKEVITTFYNAANQVIQGYPPVGGHVREDDLDYVGTLAHHAKSWTVSDHLYCTVVSAPANAQCSTEFAIGGSLLYADNLSVNLAASGAANLAIDGGTGAFAHYTGTVVITGAGHGNNSNVVVTLHKG